jgi:hypothetical protein
MANLASSSPAPTDRERIWALIREIKTFTSRDIALKTRIPRSGGAIRDYLAALEKAGFVRVLAEKKRGVFNLYELARDIGVEAPRVNKDGGILPPSGRTRMWKTMRILGTFTARELASAASLEGAPVAVDEAEYYCMWLRKGGYLRGDKKRWAFVSAMNTGPKAPQILRVKRLYDPNRNVIVCEARDQGRNEE